jgi:hypothetical protein
MFRLYAKLEGQKRFRAVNWNKGVQVNNLIHASIFTAIEVAMLQSTDLIHPANAHIEFEIREVK